MSVSKFTNSYRYVAHCGVIEKLSGSKGWNILIGVGGNRRLSDVLKLRDRIQQKKKKKKEKSVPFCLGNTVVTRSSGSSRGN